MSPACARQPHRYDPWLARKGNQRPHRMQVELNCRSFQSGPVLGGAFSCRRDQGELHMSNGLQKTLSTGALIAAMGMIGIAAASAQTVRVGPGSIGTQQGYIDPYAAYAYSPGIRVEP